MNSLKAFAVVVALFTVTACGSSPTGPSPQVAALAPAAAFPGVPGDALITLTYAINIPSRIMAQQLVADHPNGRRMSPIAAQMAYQFSGDYYGVPNVYFGPTAPRNGLYALAGIVVAPVNVASLDSFPASMWPDQYGASAAARVEWLGRFVYTVPSCQLNTVVGCPAK